MEVPDEATQLPHRIVGDQVYISTGYKVGCGLFRLEDPLEPVYKNKDMGPNHFNNSILYEEHLYGFDGDAHLGRLVTLRCMDFATGKLAWQHARSWVRLASDC